MSALGKGVRTRPFGRGIALVTAASALFYGFRLGSPALGASEAYSALAAAQHTVRGAIAIALIYDPGKPPLYHLLLHWFALCFGTGEISLRAFSVLWALGAVVLIWAIGLQLFDRVTALCAAIIWAANPIAYVLARWARMYSMFIALALLLLLLLLRARKRPASLGTAIALGLAAGALLYTHLLAILPVGAAGAILLHDLSLGRKNRSAWLGLAIGLLLFAPFLPLEVSQGHHLLAGHWVDWIGVAPHYSLSAKLGTLALGGALGLGLILVPLGGSQMEAVRICAIWLVLPIVAMVCGSVVLRPMLEVRYLAPAIPAAALLLAFALGHWGPRPRNLATCGLAALFAITMLYCRALQYSPWPDVASLVAHASPRYPVIFESGFVVSNGSLGRHARHDFPLGYFRVPFDYYCHTLNPRFAIDPASPAAPTLVSSLVNGAGGGWLVANSPASTLLHRLATGRKLALRMRLHRRYLRIYRLVPKGTR